jgi:hypothetical protein
MRMAKKSSPGRRRDPAYEVQYEAKKTRGSKANVKRAAKRREAALVETGKFRGDLESGLSTGGRRRPWCA